MCGVNDNGEAGHNFGVYLTLINCLVLSYEFLISALIFVGRCKLTLLSRLDLFLVYPTLLPVYRFSVYV